MKIPMQNHAGQMLFSKSLYHYHALFLDSLYRTGHFSYPNKLALLGSTGSSAGACFFDFLQWLMISAALSSIALPSVRTTKQPRRFMRARASSSSLRTLGLGIGAGNGTGVVIAKRLSRISEITSTVEIQTEQLHRVDLVNRLRRLHAMGNGTLATL